MYPPPAPFLCMILVHRTEAWFAESWAELTNCLDCSGCLPRGDPIPSGHMPIAYLGAPSAEVPKGANGP